MKLKQLVQIMLVSCSLLGLAACSSMHKHGSDVNDVSGGPQTSGLGESSGFGSDDRNLSPEQLLAKHVYYFEFDSSQVREQDRMAVMANADNIAAHPHTRVLIEGHTDPRGSREYNVALGERRANAVAAMLKSKGVRPDQIRVISYGAERLALPGRSEEDFQQDRRAVLVYLEH